MKAIGLCAVLLSLVLTTRILAQAEIVPYRSYAQSPAQLMKLVFGIDHPRRIDIVEPYAVVSAHGEGPLFGSRPTTELLLEHFRFGWQVVGVATDLCATQRGINSIAAQRLMMGMPKQNLVTTGCELDRGPSRSVDRIRKVMHGPIIPFVRVADNYAFSEDYSDGGGCGLFHYDAAADRWDRIGSCKGMMDPDVIERNHIPHKTVCAIRPAIADLHCP